MITMHKKKVSDYSWLLFLNQRMHDLPKSVVSLVYEKEHPASFISLYIAHRKNEVITIDSTTTDQIVNAIKQRLSTSFLGKSYIYILKNPLEDLAKKDQLGLITFLRDYKGPHYFVLAHTNSTKLATSHHTVSIPQMLCIEQSIALAQYCNAPLSVVKMMLIQVSSESQLLPFHTVVMLCEYAHLVSSAMMEDFTAHIIPRLFSPKQSLFELSKRFFSKDRSFFSLWHIVEPIYSFSFWGVFWADQLMKAALFCTYKRAHNLTEAKNVGHGLPFSFLQKDWQQYDPQLLADAYERLYMYDWQSKEGVVVKSLDPWLITFFRESSH